MSKIKAVLFDSGRVLNGPVTGHWFITPNFWDYVDKAVFESIESSKIHFAFRKADEYINTQKLIITKEFELECFIKFYEVFSNSLPELKLTNDKINLIANDLVYNPEKYVFYDDALKVIPELSKRYKLGIVSDAWPSLLDVYDKNNVTQYFGSIIISSIIGASKPDSTMYVTALKELDTSPDEAIFIDDSLKNCLGAEAVGIQSYWLCRDKKQYTLNKIKSIGKKYKVINTLYDLKKYL